MQNQSKHSTQELPADYHTYYQVNLQKDKKAALAVNIVAVVAMLAMIVLGHLLFVPLTRALDMDESMVNYFVRLAVMLAGYIAYIILHELTHAAVMKLFGATHVRFGFTGLYAYAGSEKDYFDKTAYIFVALAPLTVWGIIFTVLLVVVPQSWFWVIYFWQIGNFAGAAGDLFVTFKFLKMPSDILVRDTGVDMTVFSKTTKSE